MIPFPPFEPDRIKYAVQASDMVVNALPIKDGWGPLPDIEVFSEALSGTCVGAIVVRTSTGTYRIFAGTQTGLYELNLTDYTWTDVSGVSAPYSVPPTDRWQFEAFGDTLVAVNLSDDPQYIAIDAGTDFADLSGAPKAKFVWTAGEYLVLGHIADFPTRVHTSGIGDASYWTVGQRGCDFQDFPDGGEVMGGIGSERGAVVFQRTKIRQMTVTQVGDYSFQTSVINPSRGVISPYSICSIGPGQFAYYSQDGFFAGAEGRPIGAERVDSWFQSTIDNTYIGQIRGIADPFQKIVWWQSQDATGTKFLLGWDWQLDRWCYADNNVTEMVALVTPGVSWDGLDDLYASIDDVDIPFDSALFLGGSPRFGAFDTSNRLGFFTGASRAATLETADVQLTPGQRTFLRELHALTDGTNFTIKVAVSDRAGGARTWGSAVSPTSAGVCFYRADGRFHRARMEYAAGAEWSHVSGLDPVANASGQR